MIGQHHGHLVGTAKVGQHSGVAWIRDARRRQRPFVNGYDDKGQVIL